MIGIFEYFLKKEIPILMYHRLINNENGIGKNTIYLNIEEFEKRGKISTTLIKEMRLLNMFDGMDESSQLSLF